MKAEVPQGQDTVNYDIADASEVRQSLALNYHFHFFFTEFMS